MVVLIVASQAMRSPHVKTLLFLSQELPQSPLRPLHLLTRHPMHEQLQWEAPSGNVVADLFLPSTPGPHPAIVLAMGVKLAEQDRPLLLRLADTMARLGFVVLFPRLEVLDQGVTVPEEPETFVAAIRHLLARPEVDRERISLLGISIGASTALVAATDPAVANDVRSLVFFGGYYNMLDYLLSLATGTMELNGETSAWEPEPDAVGHMRQILEGRSAFATLGIFDAASREEAARLLEAVPAAELAQLRRFSPAERPLGASPPLFVLHDRGDRFVPYVESLKLQQAVPNNRVQAALLSSAFQHAQFKHGLSWEALTDLAALYWFVTQAIDYLDG